MEEKIRVIFKEPGKPAEVREIPNTLEALQEAVGGVHRDTDLCDGLRGDRQRRGQAPGASGQFRIPGRSAGGECALCWRRRRRILQFDRTGRVIPDGEAGRCLLGGTR